MLSNLQELLLKVRLRQLGCNPRPKNILEILRLSNWRKRTVCWCWKAYAKVNGLNYEKIEKFKIARPERIPEIPAEEPFRR